MEKTAGLRRPAGTWGAVVPKTGPGRTKDTHPCGPERSNRTRANEGHSPLQAGTEQPDPGARRTLTPAGRNGATGPGRTKDISPLRAGRDRVLGPNILIRYIILIIILLYVAGHTTPCFALYGRRTMNVPQIMITQLGTSVRVTSAPNRISLSIYKYMYIYVYIYI